MEQTKKYIRLIPTILLATFAFTEVSHSETSRLIPDDDSEVTRTFNEGGELGGVSGAITGTGLYGAGAGGNLGGIYGAEVSEESFSPEQYLEYKKAAEAAEKNAVIGKPSKDSLLNNYQPSAKNIEEQQKVATLTHLIRTTSAIPAHSSEADILKSSESVVLNQLKNCNASHTAEELFDRVEKAYTEALKSSDNIVNQQVHYTAALHDNKKFPEFANINYDKADLTQREKENIEIHKYARHTFQLSSRDKLETKLKYCKNLVHHLVEDGGYNQGDLTVIAHKVDNKPSSAYKQEAIVYNRKGSTR